MALYTVVSYEDVLTLRAGSQKLCGTNPLPGV